MSIFATLPFYKESRSIGFPNIWSNSFIDCHYDVYFQFGLRKWMFSRLFLTIGLAHDISIKGVLYLGPLACIAPWRTAINIKEYTQRYVKGSVCVFMCYCRIRVESTRYTVIRHHFVAKHSSLLGLRSWQTREMLLERAHQNPELAETLWWHI